LNVILIVLQLSYGINRLKLLIDSVNVFWDFLKQTRSLLEKFHSFNYFWVQFGLFIFLLFVFHGYCICLLNCCHYKSKVFSQFIVCNFQIFKSSLAINILLFLCKLFLLVNLSLKILLFVIRQSRLFTLERSYSWKWLTASLNLRSLYEFFSLFLFSIWLFRGARLTLSICLFF